MKTLRASSARLTSDVIVGRNEYGGDVTVTVTLDRKDPEVTEALSDLDALLRRRAFAHLNEAIEEAVVQKRVAESVARQRQSITATAKANAEATMTARLKELERQLATSQRENVRLADQNNRLAKQVQASTEKEG